MSKILLNLEGISTVADLVSVRHLESQRSSLEVRARQMLDRGRSCHVQTRGGRMLDCVISNVIKEGDTYLLDLRTAEDASFLANPGEHAL